jgi:hypothetical protein
MLYWAARALQLLGLVLLPVAMAFQLHGLPLKSMLVLAAAGVALFYLGYLLQRHAPR